MASDRGGLARSIRAVRIRPRHRGGSHHRDCLRLPQGDRNTDIESTLDQVIRGAGKDPAFLGRLASTVPESRVPVGRVRDIVERER